MPARHPDCLWRRSTNANRGAAERNFPRLPILIDAAEEDQRTRTCAPCSRRHDGANSLPPQPMADQQAFVLIAARRIEDHEQAGFGAPVVKSFYGLNMLPRAIGPFRRALQSQAVRSARSGLPLSGRAQGKPTRPIVARLRARAAARMIGVPEALWGKLCAAAHSFSKPQRRQSQPLHQLARSLRATAMHQSPTPGQIATVCLFCRRRWLPDSRRATLQALTSPASNPGVG